MTRNEEATGGVPVFIDTDLSHDPNDIPALVAPILAGEIEMLVRDYEIREIHFEDDNFTLKCSHAAAVCEEILRRLCSRPSISPSGSNSTMCSSIATSPISRGW